MSRGTGTTSAAPSHDEADSGPQQALFDLVQSGRSFSGREKNCCYLNLGKSKQSGRRFVDVSAVSGVDFSDDARAVSLVDWDFDGDVDLWIANRNGPQARFLRNDSSSGNHHLSLRLRGTTSNRDAIGARVEVWPVDSGPTPFVKTLRAGDGYLSQSSKWLVFGLGAAKEIERVVVRWPGGAAEEFRGLQVDEHHELVQNSGVATLWTPPAPSKPLARSRLTSPADSGRVETMLAARVPLPKMQYKSFTGETVTLRTYAGRAFLLNLWASWCVPCVGELKEFTERARDLRKAGLGVVALSLDALGGKRTSTQKDPRALLEKVAYPDGTTFVAGHANAELLDKLQIINDRIFSLRLPLPVPTSFLVDASGRVAAIYKGAIGVDRLLEDVGRLAAKPAALRSFSLPFEGRWHRPPSQLRVYSLIMDLIKKDFLIEAKDLAARHVDELRRDADYPRLLARLGNEEYERDRIDPAIKRYREALKLDPELASAHLNLAVALWQKRQVPEALDSYRAAVRYDPTSVKAHQELATRLAQIGRRQEALGPFQEAVKLDPRSGELRANYGLLLLQLGQSDAGREQLREAVRLEPGDARVRLNLGLALVQEYPEAAIEEFRETLRLDSSLDAAYFQLARVLATHQDDRIRDGNAALSYAETLANRTGFKEPRALSLLAIAYAEVGRFGEAIETAEKAEVLALEKGNEKLAAECRRCLERYRAGQVCRP